MSTTYDAIVVGSGPSGSTAARELAQHGVSTLLLDKASFPRDKPCGGGVTIRTSRLLPFDLSPVTEQVVSRVRMSFRRGRLLSYESDTPLVYMTQRRRLDEYLVERAVAAGATFRDGTAVRSIEFGGGPVTVRTEQDVYSAGIVVGADGANGIVARTLGVPSHVMGVALEGNVPYSSRLHKEWDGALGLDLGDLPGGYGWIFPKGDHLNVGVGGWRDAVGTTLRSHLSALARYYNTSESDLFGLKGHHLPMRRPGSPIVGEQAVLLGDAAGLVDPISGEGIFSAIRSAQIAVPRVVGYLSGRHGELQAYEGDIDTLLMPELNASRQMQYIFHAMPSLYMRIYQLNSWGWNASRRLISGETSFDSIMNRFGIFRRGVDMWAAMSKRRLAGTAPA